MIKKYSLHIWFLIFVLNILNCFLSLNISGKTIAILWLILSIYTLFCIYNKFENNITIKIIMLFVAFVSAFFTSYLFFGYVDYDTFYFSILSAIIVFSLTMGVGIIV